MSDQQDRLDEIINKLVNYGKNGYVTTPQLPAVLPTEAKTQILAWHKEEEQTIRNSERRKIIEWVQTNQKGIFENERGNTCWYLDDLVASLEADNE